MLKDVNRDNSSTHSLIVIATFIVAIFFPILGYGWMAIEDPSYYQTNPLFGQAPLINRLLAAWFNAPESNYIPLTWNFTTLLAEFTQDSPHAFHALSLLLHLLNSALAFFLLRRLGLANTSATLAVLLFALHPLRVESVVWASSIKGLLAASFALAGLLLQASPRAHFRSSLIVLLFLLSLLSKQTLLLLPLIHYLISNTNPEYHLKKCTYLALGILTILAAITASQANAGNTLLAINQFLDGNIALLKGFSALGHHLKLQLLPFPLLPEYPATRQNLLIFLGLLSIIPAALLTKSLLFSKRPPLALTSFTSFLILLFPTLGFLATPLKFTADRLTYLPSLFFWTSLALLLTQLSYPKSWPKAQSIPLALLLLIFIPLTLRQTSYWKNDTTLTSHILQHQPKHYLANLHVSNQYASNGNYQAALPFAKILVQEHPHRYGGWKTYSGIQIHLNQPNIPLKALEQLLANGTPNRANLHLIQGDLLRASGRFEEALESSKQAQIHGMDALTAHYKNALTYHAANKPELALNELESALSLEPQSPPVIALKKKITAH